MQQALQIFISRRQMPVKIFISNHVAPNWYIFIYWAFK